MTKSATHRFIEVRACSCARPPLKPQPVVRPRSLLRPALKQAQNGRRSGRASYARYARRQGL